MRLKAISINDIKIRNNRRTLGDIAELAKSINKIGLLNPITVTEDLYLVAGYHRLKACSAVGWTEITANIKSLNDLQAELAELDENLLRNDLTVLERSEQLERRKVIYLELYPETRQGLAGGKALAAKKADEEASEIISFAGDIADKTGLSKRTIEQEIQIAKKITTPVKEVIRNTPLADSKVELLQLARLKPQQQEIVVNKIVAGESKNLSSAISELRQNDRIQKIVTNCTKDINSLGRFPLIYADPPWQYEFCSDLADKIENHYPTMTLEAICNLPIQEVAHKDCILFLWTTSPKLYEAMRVLDAWGFSYRSNAIWDKKHIGRGYYFRQRHEQLLVAVKGDMPAPTTGNRPDSIIAEKHTEHSKKPDQFYEIIETMYPDLPKLELFARNSRPGWASWGNQVAA